MSNRPRLLDLFCGAGGAAVGYYRAGFDVVGVDVVDQPRYPFDFVLADATLYPLDGFDAVHASPPCTDHTELWSAHRERGTAWMLTDTIARFAALDVPWVIENVPGARYLMPNAFTLCGRSFGLGALKRHRLFMSNVFMFCPPCACGREPTIGVYGDLSANDRPCYRPTRNAPTMRAGVATARRLMDCEWMNGYELTQAIPPAYTEFIGEALLAACRPAAG